jgi:hypothetical protein
MKPTDLRDATFDRIRSDISGRLRQVYEAWERFGPTTTRNLAQLSGIDILNVRPRTTDLVALGLVELVNDFRGSEGIYRARSAGSWAAWHSSFFSVASQQFLDI